MRKFLLLPFLLFAGFMASAFWDAPKPEITALAQSIKPLRAADVASLIEGSERPVVLFLYATWCPYCRQTWEEAAPLLKEGAFTGFNTLFISLDTDFIKLAKYLDEHGYAELSPPFAHRRSGLAPLEETLARRFRTRFNGGIPYMAVFSGGHLLAEAGGAQTREEIAAMLKKALQ